MNALTFVSAVRRRLNNPLMGSPSPRQILDRGFDAYRMIGIKANNTGHAWATDEFTLTATTGVRRYDVTTSLAPRFSKPLLVATVPSSVAGVNEPELPLDFTQIEQLPRDWAWLNSSGINWSLWQGDVTQSARWVAFYRTISDTAGFKMWMEIRPTPIATELYRVLYEVGNWQGLMTASAAPTFQLPFPELDAYFIAWTAQSLLPLTRYSSDPSADVGQLQGLAAGLESDLRIYDPIVEAFLASLTVTDLVYGESFADSLGL